MDLDAIMGAVAANVAATAPATTPAAVLAQVPAATPAATPPSMSLAELATMTLPGQKPAPTALAPTAPATPAAPAVDPLAGLFPVTPAAAPVAPAPAADPRTPVPDPLAYADVVRGAPVETPIESPPRAEVVRAGDVLAMPALDVARDFTRDATGEPPITTLYLNCAPTRRTNAVQASDLIHDAERELRNGGCLDFRLVDFGKGKGLLAAAVAKRIRHADAVVLWTDTDAGAACADVFAAAAAEVVRGRA
jgi:hypothetical protein